MLAAKMKGIKLADINSIYRTLILNNVPISNINFSAFFLQANIHSIMDAEPQVESLMQLLNDALNELDHLDTRLTGYDTRLRVSSLE